MGGDAVAVVVCSVGDGVCGLDWIGSAEEATNGVIRG